jgi:hypothetical protein
VSWQHCDNGQARRRRPERARPRDGTLWMSVIVLAVIRRNKRRRIPRTRFMPRVPVGTQYMKPAQHRLRDHSKGQRQVMTPESARAFLPSTDPGCQVPSSHTGVRGCNERRTRRVHCPIVRILQIGARHGGRIADNLCRTAGAVQSSRARTTPTQRSRAVIGALPIR